MAPSGRRWCLAALAIAAIVVAGSSATTAPTAHPDTIPVVPAATPPCPFIRASSPQTLSTTPSPIPLNPCPGIVAGTYFGGNSTDVVTDVAVDASGNIYITGYTNSTDFPTTPDAYDPTFNGVPVEFNGYMWISIYDAFLAKFTLTGALVFSTFFGGTSSDTGRSIALDSSGNAYITGLTSSSDFPVTEGAFETGLGINADGVGTDAFVAKFDSDGALLYSTFLGGQKGAEWGHAIAVDPLGNAYVTGRTWSRDFPIRADFVHRATYVDDVFVAKLNPDGTALEYSTVIGGSDVDFAQSIAVDTGGRAYVAGWTFSPDFPVTHGAFDTSMNNPEIWDRDGFVFRLNAAAASLDYSTFLGGSFWDEIRAVVVDGASNAYLTGVTESADFPTTPGAFDTTPHSPDLSPCCDAFAAKLDASGSTLLYSTFLGGTKTAAGSVGYDEGNGIFVDDSGQAYVVGATDSMDFPTSLGAYDATYNGESWQNQDGFVTKLDPEGRTLGYSTFLGGGDDVLYVETQPDRDLCSQYCGDLGYSLAIDSTGNTTIVGTTNALDFPVTEEAYDPTFNGGRFDVFIVRMELIPEPNRAPVAYFEVTSSPEEPSRVFVDATDSADAEDSTNLLEVRWDWKDDGSWDSDWSTVKTASHEYAWGGTYTIRLEVRDTGGLSGDATRQVAVAGPPVIQWIRQFGTSESDWASGIAVDVSGVYVAGLTESPSLDRFDAFVRKYDVDGGEVWSRQFGFSCGAGGGSLDFYPGIAVDASGVYVAGTMSCFNEFGLEPFIRKYDAQGNEIWTHRFDTLSHDLAHDIAVDASGVYVAGMTCCVTDEFGNSKGNDAFVRKYDTDGNEMWTRQFGTSGLDWASGIAVDVSGVYLAGKTEGALPGQTYAGLEDAFVGRYDLDGNEMWTRQFGTSGYDAAGAVTIDASGVYVDGWADGPLPGQASSGDFVRKYDIDGNEIWTWQFVVSGDVHDFAVDSSGVYLAGKTLGVLPGQTYAGLEDAFVGRYDFDGNDIWTRQFGTTGFDLARTIAVDTSGVYAAGSTEGTFLGQINAGGSDAFVAKLEPQYADLPPVLSVPGPITVEATGPSGVTANYVATAEDDVDGSITPICSPFSGSVFPLGTVTVTCTARDSAGNEATAMFTVEVRDTRPPILTVPNDITVEATGPSGATVAFDATALDVVDPSPPVNCSPTSGSTFDIGTTTVTCTATDFAGNNAIASFRVTVTDGSIGPSGLNLGPTEVAAIVVALGAAATAVVALMRRKRKGRDPNREGGGAS